MLILSPVPDLRKKALSAVYGEGTSMAFFLFRREMTFFPVEMSILVDHKTNILVLFKKQLERKKVPSHPVPPVMSLGPFDLVACATFPFPFPFFF